MNCIHNLSIAALISATMLSLTACGPDEPETTPNPEPTPDIVTGKWVLASYTDSHNNNSVHFEYDEQGRVVKITEDDSRYIATYVYSSSSIGYESLDKYEGTSHYYTYTLHSGLISSLVINGDSEFEATYNSSKQMTRVVNYGTDYYSMKWVNGNIEEIQCSVDYDGDYRQEFDMIITYAANSLVNQTCIAAINAFLLDETKAFGIEMELAFSGYYGKMPSQLITGIKSTYENGDNPNKVTYGNIDANGCPGTITITNGYQQTTSYILNWKKL